MVNLAIDPPPSSQRERPRRGALAFAFSLVAVVALAAGFWIGRATAPGKREAQPTAAATPAASAPPAPDASAVPASATAAAIATSGTTATPSAIATAAAPPSPSASAAAAVPGVRRLSVTLNGPLEDSIASALPAGDRALAEELTAVVNRILVWDLHVARDGRRGDRLDLIWAPPIPGVQAANEPVVHALRFNSSKLGAVIAAYRYQPNGARWPHYYRADGSEVEARLVDPPVADYEQITSLLRDGRRHKGVDFKTPVGSPVVAPFDGVIERRNWHFAANGNCLDIRDPATGRHAIFLHLDVIPKDRQPGRKVKKGEVIASSGNTGHSFAPHVHYQLEDASGRVLDPFEVLRTVRRTLPASEKASFDAERTKLDAALGG